MLDDNEIETYKLGRSQLFEELKLNTGVCQ